ncbi:MAG: ABC transporter ATP-binding protein, partial [Myxococcota bacterium]
MPPRADEKGGSKGRDEPGFTEKYLGVFKYSARAVQLVWTTSPVLTLTLAVLTVFAGALPAGTAYVGKLIVDQVVEAAATQAAGARELVFVYVALEGALVVALAGVQRGLSIAQSLLRA